MRRRTLLVALAGLAVVVAAGAVVLWPRLEPPSRITQENCDQIREGMHQADVEAILGPPGDYTMAGPSNTFFDTHGPIITHQGGGVSCFWVGDRAIAYVVFDEYDRCRQWNYREAGTVPQTGWENLLWRAKRQWHRWFPE
jgi:hypothetical protein